MKITFHGDSLTAGRPGVSFFPALEAMLPGDQLINDGKGGETVISLYRRIARDARCDPVDIAVLWVGVNDVLATVTGSHSVLKRLMRQPRARDHTQFRDTYRRILQLLGKRATSVLAVSPLLIGEDLENPWNEELASLCEIIASVCVSFDNVQYLDLRARAAEQLKEKQASGYLPVSVTSIACEALLLRTSSRVDRVARRRGLSLTLDGVHLNSTGAAVIAQELRCALRRLAGSPERPSDQQTGQEWPAKREAR